MSSPVRLRPTFTVPLRVDRAEAIERIKEGLSSAVPAERWIGKGRWAELHVPGGERRIWSPYLSVRLDELDAHHRAAGQPEGTQSVLFARFAPRPEVWTGFIFLYAAIAFLTLLGGIFAYVQWASNEPAWGVWALVLGVPLLAALHLGSWLGQRWSQAQMVELKQILDPVVEPLRVEGG
jgi:hypothetical protein